MRNLARFVAIVGFFVVVAGCTKPKPKATTEEKLVPVATLSADDLVDEYKKNQIGADQKYKEKLIQVTGKVTEIGKLPLAGYYIDLGSSNEGDLFGIKCILDKSDQAAEEKAGKLKPGDTITIAGRCEGKAAGQALYLRYCYFPQ
jgi:hypothetical protein